MCISNTEHDQLLAATSHTFHAEVLNSMEGEKELVGELTSSSQKKRKSLSQDNGGNVDNEDGMPMMQFWSNNNDDIGQPQRVLSKENSSGEEEDGEEYTKAAGGNIFPTKLFVMLQDAEAEGFTDVVSWVKPNETTFRVHKRSDFETRILPKYFKMKKYKSFTRQLHNYCFGCVNKGPETGECKCVSTLKEGLRLLEIRLVSHLCFVLLVQILTHHSLEIVIPNDAT